MKIFQLSFIAMMVTALLTGCQIISNTAKHTTTNPAKAIIMPLSDSKLQNYHWQLVSVTDKVGNATQKGLFFDKNKPLIVSFNKGGRVVLENTCNNLSANYMLTNDNVVVGDMVATRMMCEPALMAFDSLAPSTLQGQFKLTQGEHGKPVLTVTSDNQINVFEPVK